MPSREIVSFLFNVTALFKMIVPREARAEGPSVARLINQSGRRPERSESLANSSEKYIYIHIYIHIHIYIYIYIQYMDIYIHIHIYISIYIYTIYIYIPTLLTLLPPTLLTIYIYIYITVKCGRSEINTTKEMSENVVQPGIEPGSPD